MTKKAEQIEIIYPIKIEKELWERFKTIIPRTVTLNRAIITLIEKELTNNGPPKKP